MGSFVRSGEVTAITEISFGVISCEFVDRFAAGVRPIHELFRNNTKILTVFGSQCYFTDRSVSPRLKVRL